MSLVCLDEMDIFLFSSLLPSLFSSLTKLCPPLFLFYVHLPPLLLSRGVVFLLLPPPLPLLAVVL